MYRQATSEIPFIAIYSLIFHIASHHRSMDQLAEILVWSQKNKVYILLFYFALSAL